MLLKANQLKTVLSLVAVIGLYQNCAPANFQASNASSQKAIGNIDVTGAGDGSPGMTLGTSSPISGAASGEIVANGGAGGTAGTNPLPAGSKQLEEEDYDTNIPAQVVECEIHSPSVKVVLQDNLNSSHSNASATRVCMSSHACLDLINAYSADRDCTLNSGAATSPKSGVQCTRIFPGSRGTCNNAKLVSDSFIHDLLVKMAK